MTEQILIVVGAGIFGLLGTLHLIYTFWGTAFEARDPSVTDAMKSSSIKLTPDTSVWLAWVGFNASHSLGAMIFAGIYIPLAIAHPNILHSFWFSIL